MVGGRLTDEMEESRSLLGAKLEILRRTRVHQLGELQREKKMESLQKGVPLAGHLSVWTGRPWGTLMNEKPIRT